MVAIGTSTLIGVAVTIFFSILGIGVSFLYKISINIQGIENSIDRMDQNLGGKLDQIEENTRESANLLHRIAERTRQDDEYAAEGENEGDRTDTDGGTNVSTTENGEIIDSNHEPERDNPDPSPDIEHIDEDPRSDTSEEIEWGYGYHALDRIEQMDKLSRAQPDELPEDADSKIIGVSDEESEQPKQSDQHWVTEEAEDISFAVSREIGGNNLYLSVAVSEEVSQVNYHIAQAGFPGLVGADPKQNKITEQVLEAAQKKHGDNAVLSVRSGQVIVSLPITSLDDIREWIEESTQIIEDIVMADSRNSDSTKEQKTE